MEISFRIHYHTQFRQQLSVSGDLPSLGGGEPENGKRMRYLGDGQWELSLIVDDPPERFSYSYVLADENDGSIQREWGAPREVNLRGVDKRYLQLHDAWRAHQHPENTLYTSAFTRGIFQNGKSASGSGKKAVEKKNTRFQIRCPRIAEDQEICISGSSKALGEWDYSRAILLTGKNYPVWSVDLSMDDEGEEVAYKYGIYSYTEKRVLFLEEGENRIFSKDRNPEQGEFSVITDEYFRHPLGLWKGAGVAIPVFSLRSRRGLGVGEFADLRLMVDWAAEVGLKVVQILPVNDTTATHSWKDSYPYAAISVFALNPLYLNLEDIDGFEKHVDRKDYEKHRKKLNESETVAFPEVMKLKWTYSRQIYEGVREEWLQSSEVSVFLEENGHWLKPYAIFCYLRDKYGTPDFRKWEKHAAYSDRLLQEMTDEEGDLFFEIGYFYFIQYYLDRQLRRAAEYARSRGMVLKGDIPIGIYRHSVDAWVEPRLYNMDGQAGAPPDPFSETGQNWGFPTYDWEEMAKDGYKWWQQRLQQLSRYFDTFRIDHILGFFRIWQIPLDQVEGLMGTFNPALPVRREEFDARGIPFDYDRYCKPHIPEHLLLEYFSKDSGRMKDIFFEEVKPHQYRFVEELDNQRAIARFLEKAENEELRPYKGKLFDLVSNILFFEQPGSNRTEFHPRIFMQKTRSFGELPAEVRARLDELYVDYFYRRQEEFWRHQAMTKLPAIKEATNMLICGEDLGMVPDCVPGVMKELDILSLEIQRMSKNPKTEFLQEEDIPYLSVCSPSTHDMSPIRAWWEEADRHQLRHFYNEELGFEGGEPFFCEPYVAERIVLMHLYWPSMWAIFPIQDLLAMDADLRRANPYSERINIPSDPDHRWCYRFHINLEDLGGEDAFNNRLRALITGSGRANH